MDEENDAFRIMPSCYSLLAFLRDLGSRPVKDAKCRGEKYLRASFFGSIPVIIEWDMQGDISGDIDFRGVDDDSIEDIIEKFAKIGVAMTVEDTDFFRIGHFQLEIRHLSKPVCFLEKIVKEAEKDRRTETEMAKRQNDVAYSLTPPHC